ncbi:nucleotidyltransferase family protein [Mesobaculum littorinae]|uniref:Nucleotidyltransferase family protein n=2 Tax=Mesobaculum littorinae TaxID=2486419 RepID=A0A438ALW1_9RHOB|nr:nucleotidyltransferase family protein [Mesobaculum littorinae]
MRGRDKLLELVAGAPLLRCLAERALGASAPVYVTLPPEVLRPGRHAALDGVPVTRVVVPDPAEGMAASFRAGVAAIGDDPSGLMVMLADMPEIVTADLARMIAAFGAAPNLPLRATTADGLPGFPVIFPRRLYPALSRLSGDVGGKEVLTGERVATLSLPGQRARLDLDTPEAWAAWRGTENGAR